MLYIHLGNFHKLFPSSTVCLNQQRKYDNGKPSNIKILPGPSEILELKLFRKIFGCFLGIIQ